MATPLSASTLAEIQRKKSQNIPLTNKTPQAMAAYNSYKPPAAKPAAPKMTPPTTGGVPSYTQQQRVPGTAVGTPTQTQPTFQPHNPNNPTPIVNYANGGGSIGGVAAASNVSTPKLSPVNPTVGLNINGGYATGRNAVEDALAGAGKEYAGATDQAGRDAAHAKAMGIGSAAGWSYDSRLGKWSAPAPVTPAVSTPTPTGDAVTTPRSAAELQQSAGDQNAIERAALDTAVRERLTALRNNAEYNNKLLQDNRTLEDWNMSQTLSPFNGHTSYDKAMVNRGRGIDDSARASELNNQLGATQEELFNFDKLAPERQRQIYNELLKNERDFGLNVGQLTGNYGGQRTLAGQQFDWGQNMDVADRTGYIGGAGGGGYGGNSGGSMGARSILPQTPTRTLQGQQFDRGIYEDDRNYNYQQGRDKVGDNQWQKAFDQNKYESDRNYQHQVQQDAVQSGHWQQQFSLDADKYGFQKASELWSQAFQQNNANQDDAYRKAQLEQDMSQQDRIAVNQMSDTIMKSGLVTVNKDTGAVSVQSPDALNQYIKSLHLSDNATDSLLYQFQLGAYVKK